MWARAGCRFCRGRCASAPGPGGKGPDRSDVFPELRRRVCVRVRALVCQRWFSTCAWPVRDFHRAPVASSTLSQEMFAHLLAVTPPQLDLLPIGQLPAAHDDSAVKLAVGRIGHVLFLHGRVDHHFLFPPLGRGSGSIPPKSVASRPPRCGGGSGPGPRVRTARPTAFAFPAEVLPVGVFPPRLHHRFVAQVVKLFQDEQPHHQTYRLGRTALLAIERAELLSKSPHGIFPASW